MGTTDLAPDDSFVYRAFAYDGALRNLGTLGGNYSDATDVNDAGVVVGAATLPREFERHAYLDDGVMHDLGTLGGNFSESYGLNSAGQVVGWSRNRDCAISKGVWPLNGSWPVRRW